MPRKGTVRRYYVQLRWQIYPDQETIFKWIQGGYSQKNHAYRQRAVIPILFESREAAENYMNYVDIFKNLRGVKRKLSASVEFTYIMEKV